MILQSLYQYYEILSRDPSIDIAPPGYCTTGVSFALEVSIDGNLINLIPLFEQVARGKFTDEKPRRMIVPEQVKRAVNIAANFLCDNSTYTLNLTGKDAKDPEYSLKRFNEFKRFNLELLRQADCDPARAVMAFLENYDPLTGHEHPVIALHLERLLGPGNLLFHFDGKPVSEDLVVRQVWERYKAGKDSKLGQCLVTGDYGPVARLHPSLKGIRNANSTGASLVGFNASAYESYNRSQGQNSPVSEKATFGYTTALNYLLSSANPNRKLYLGDTTIIYWAESEKSEYASAFASLIEPGYIEAAGEEGQTGRKKAEERLNEAAEKIRHVQPVDINNLRAGLDEKTRFHVLGLAPNAARIAVRFFLSEPFGKIVDRIMQHYEDLKIIKEFEDQPTYINIRQIVNETVSKKSADKDASPLMSGAVMRAILSGGAYPAALYYAIINRIRADMDDKQARIRKINYTRAAIIKAFLLRKYKHQTNIKEVLVMSLNKNATQPAYVLGRLFAIMEKAQQEALRKVNAGIKDRYFTSACASPASVFPVLLRLTQHHITRAEYGKYLDGLIEDILALLEVEKNPIPSRLTLDEQGIFVLGYYHQRADFYMKSSASKEANSIEN